tara:strand:- start:376 stop:687 length:312 start_codon:yes stop_codon:yes gene_type:complete
METLSDISLAQWIFIAVGLVIALPPVLSFFKGSVKIPGIKVKTTNNELTDLVRKWEALSDACQASGLHKACQTLDGVFPLLIEVREDTVEIEPDDKNLIPKTT